MRIVLKATIVSDGIWRIRRAERSHQIEVFKVEEHGSGRILLPEFITWRETLLAKEVAQMLAK
jgi:RAT1-interacting protein